MLFQVIISSGMYSFNLFKHEWEFIFDVSCSICIMSKFNMIVKTVILTSKTKRLVPFHPYLFPFFKPIQFTPRLYKELHFHLFKFSHPEDELSGNYFIAKRFSYLSNPKRNFHPSGLLNIEKIDEDPLRSLGSEIN